MSKNDRCPTCGKAYTGWKPKRVCYKCKQIIGRGHKWIFSPDGTVNHINCNNVESYCKESEFGFKKRYSF
jgi:hypothetical protein